MYHIESDSNNKNPTQSLKRLHLLSILSSSQMLRLNSIHFFSSTISLKSYFQPPLLSTSACKKAHSQHERNQRKRMQMPVPPLTPSHPEEPWWKDPADVPGPDLAHSWDIEGLRYGVSTVSFCPCFHWSDSDRGVLMQACFIPQQDEMLQVQSRLCAVHCTPRLDVRLYGELDVPLDTTDFRSEEPLWLHNNHTTRNESGLWEVF